MKFLRVFNVWIFAFLVLSCRPVVEEVVSEPTEAELSAALQEVTEKVEGVKEVAPTNPNVLGEGHYRYQVEALMDGSFELQCRGIARGEILRDLGINFTESSECVGSILSWVLDLNRYLPSIGDTSPLTIDHNMMPYALNVASISTKDIGSAKVTLARHVNYGEFEIYRETCPQGFCTKFEKMEKLLTYWAVKRTTKSTESIREGSYLAAFSKKNGTAVLLKTIFSGSFKIADSDLSVPLRITIEIDDMQDSVTH